VENVDAIKVWTEQIECALAGLKPEYHVARLGITYLERNKNRPRKCKKLLYMLDAQPGTFQSRLMDEWLLHFDGLDPKTILCVLVRNTQENVHTLADIEKGQFNLVNTDFIVNKIGGLPL